MNGIINYVLERVKNTSKSSKVGNDKAYSEIEGQCGWSVVNKAAGREDDTGKAVKLHMMQDLRSHVRELYVTRNKKKEVSIQK